MKKLRQLFWSLAIPCVMMFGGCNTPAKFEEVSSDAAYREYIGSVYVLEVPMHLSGVNAPPGYGKAIDFYVLNPTSPSWSGPELITRETLPKGTMVRIESVQRCTNCILDPGVRLEARVRIRDHRTQFDRPINLPLRFLDPQFARKESHQPGQPPVPSAPWPT